MGHGVDNVAGWWCGFSGGGMVWEGCLVWW